MCWESIHLLCFQSYLRSELTVSTTLPDLTLRSSRITHPSSQPPRENGFKLAQCCFWFHHQAGDSADASIGTWEDGKEMKQEVPVRLIIFTTNPSVNGHPSLPSEPQSPPLAGAGSVLSKLQDDSALINNREQKQTVATRRKLELTS